MTPIGSRSGMTGEATRASQAYRVFAVLAISSICFLDNVCSSVFDTQYTPESVRQATSRTRSPSMKISYSRLPIFFFSSAPFRIGGALQRGARPPEGFPAAPPVVVHPEVRSRLPAALVVV